MRDGFVLCGGHCEDQHAGAGCSPVQAFDEPLNAEVGFTCRSVQHDAITELVTVTGSQHLGHPDGGVDRCGQLVDHLEQSQLVVCVHVDQLDGRRQFVAAHRQGGDRAVGRCRFDSFDGRVGTQLSDHAVDRASHDRERRGCPPFNRSAVNIVGVFGAQHQGGIQQRSREHGQHGNSQHLTRTLSQITADQDTQRTHRGHHPIWDRNWATRSARASRSVRGNPASSSSPWILPSRRYMMREA